MRKVKKEGYLVLTTVASENCEFDIYDICNSKESVIRLTQRLENVGIEYQIVNVRPVKLITETVVNVELDENVL
jgi:hypothetical protein